MNEIKKEQTNHKITTSTIAIIGVMTAITCILGPLSVPIGTVPVSLTMLAIYLSVIILGWKKGTISYLIYLLIGFVGVPVFSGFTGGAGKLFGPTGGYLIGMIALAVISGLFVDKFPGNIGMYAVGMILGALVNYVFGTVWLAKQVHMTFQAALAVGVIPFILPDLAKIVIAILLGTTVKKQLAKAHLL